MSPDCHLQLREVHLQERLQQVATRCTTPDAARRLVAFALRCVKETPLPDGTTLAPRLPKSPSLREVVQMVEGWLAGRPLADRHYHLHVDVVRVLCAVTPDPAVRAAVHQLYLATRCAEAADTCPEKIGEAAGHAGIAAFKVRRPLGQTWPTPQALDYQERLFAEMFPAAELAGCPAAWERGSRWPVASPAMAEVSRGAFLASRRGRVEAASRSPG
jgi:hypothetical protein